VGRGEGRGGEQRVGREREGVGIAEPEPPAYLEILASEVP
jgi:hypothetical protein